MIEGFSDKLFTYSNDAILIVDGFRDEILEVNPGACTMLGYLREDLLRTPVSAIHPDEMPRLRAFARSVLDRGHGWTDELTCTRKDGRVLQAEISATPIDLGGRVCIAAMVRDISDRKLAEEALRRHAQRLEILHEIERGLLGARSLDEIAQSVVPQVRELARCSRASVTLFDLEGSTARVIATDGVHDPAIGPGARLPLTKLPPSETAGAESTRPVQILETGSLGGHRSEAERALEALGIRSVAWMPLVASGELVGSLNLGWRSASEAPDAHDIETVREVADDLAVAIRQDRLQTELTSRAEELEGLVADLRSSDEQRRRLLARLVRAQEDERARIAGEIHDDTIQKMAAVHIRLGSLRRKLQTSEDRKHVETLEATVAASIASLRDLVFDLRPVALDREGLAAALHLYLEGLQAAEGLRCTLDDRLFEPPPDPARTICYRVALEALSNVRRHANASRVDVRLEASEGGVLVRIVDNGRGFDGDRVEEVGGHLGLTAMRERAETAGGWFEIASSPTLGTRVAFWVPMSE